MTNALIYAVFLLEEFWVSQTMQNISIPISIQLPSVIGHAFFSHTFTHIFTHEITLFLNFFLPQRKSGKFSLTVNEFYSKYAYVDKVLNEVLKCSMNPAATLPDTVGGRNKEAFLWVCNGGVCHNAKVQRTRLALFLNLIHTFYLPAKYNPRPPAAAKNNQRPKLLPG